MKWNSFDKIPRKSANCNEEFPTSETVLAIGPYGACLVYYDFSENSWQCYNEDQDNILTYCEYWTYFRSIPEEYKGMFDVDFF